MHVSIMSRVVHSTILATHPTYLLKNYDRCFLHLSASMLREAVVMVLSIGLELQQTGTSNLPIHYQDPDCQGGEVHQNCSFPNGKAETDYERVTKKQQHL